MPAGSRECPCYNAYVPWDATSDCVVIALLAPFVLFQALHARSVANTTLCRSKVVCMCLCVCVLGIHVMNLNNICCRLGAEDGKGCDRNSTKPKQYVVCFCSKACKPWSANRELSGWPRGGCRDRCQEGPEKAHKPWIRGKNKGTNRELGRGQTVKCKPWIRHFQPPKFQCFSSQCGLHGLRPLVLCLCSLSLTRMPCSVHAALPYIIAISVQLAQQSLSSGFRWILTASRHEGAEESQSRCSRHNLSNDICLTKGKFLPSAGEILLRF